MANQDANQANRIQQYVNIVAFLLLNILNKVFAKLLFWGKVAAPTLRRCVSTHDSIRSCRVSFLASNRRYLLIEKAVLSNVGVLERHESVAIKYILVHCSNFVFFLNIPRTETYFLKERSWEPMLLRMHPKKEKKA